MTQMINYKTIITEFCDFKRLPDITVRYSNTEYIDSIAQGAYVAKTCYSKPYILLAKTGLDIHTLLHELAHHYQFSKHKRSIKTHHDSTFTNAKRVLQRYLVSYHN